MMKKPVLYKLLKTLSKNEWKELMIFSRIHHSKKSDPYIILEYLDKNRLTFPTIEDLQLLFFPNSSRRNVSNKLGEIKTTVEEFFIWKQMTRNSSLKGFLRIEAYFYRGLFSISKSIIKKYKDELLRKMEFNTESYYFAHKLFDKAYFYFSDFKRLHGSELLAKSAKYLERYSTFYRSKIDFEEKFLDKFQNSNKYEVNSDFDLTPSNNIYLFYKNLNSLCEFPNLNHINKIYSSLSVWPKQEIDDLFLLSHQRSLNAAKYEYLKGDILMKEIILKLYELGFENSIYEINGYIPGNAFCSILQSIIALDNKKLAEELILRYDHQIEPTERKTALALSNADLALQDYKFDLVLDFLNDININAMWSNIKYRWLKILSLIGLENENEQLNSFQNSFYAFFKSNEKIISKRNFEMSMNLLNLIRLLEKKVEKDRLLIFIKRNPNIAMKTWIISFINKTTR